ncbi:MAG TPA: hypothetical protein VNO17_06260, partial [Actinomycetota bacterium]|nr:hypothetical protein [Actinomycetota bacterium]
MRRPARPRPLAALLSVLIPLAACTRGTLPDPGPPRQQPSPPVTLVVAFLRDASHPAFLSRILPAEQGLRLALDRAEATLGAAVVVEPVDLDATSEDPAAPLDELAADPAVVAAVLGPEAAPAPEVTGGLAGAGIPIVSLSSLARRPAAAAAWRSLVPPARAEGVALGRLLRHLPAARDGVCLAV